MAKLTTRAEDYSKWYNELVVKANLAENSGVRGCMVIKPYGYAIWEKLQAELDRQFKETGHQNAYFPIFIPKSLFEAEEKNAEGFAKECAVVTHYRLKNDPDNKGKLIVDPDAKLEEELIVRPTSEAIIWSTYKNWIQSYRDLPILINQWPMLFVGKCVHAYFYAPQNSYGKKDIPHMRHVWKPKKKQSKCRTFTKMLLKISWLFQL